MIPFLLWSFFGLLFKIINGSISTNQLSFSFVMDGIMNVRFVDIYWFFVSLMTVYISIPVFGYIQEEYREKMYLYIIILGLILNVLLPFAFNFIPDISYNPNLSMPIGSGYLIYVLLGYWIDQYHLKRWKRYAIYLIGIGELLLHIFGTYYFSYKYGMIDGRFKGYLGVASFSYSTAVFVFFRYMDFSKWNRYFLLYLKNASKYTFGVYLIHWYIINTLVFKTSLNQYSLVFRVVGAIAIFGVSLALVYLLNSSDEEKEEDAYVFAKRYKDHIEEFLTFISDSDFSRMDGYKESWDFIKTDLHSLERHTNLGLCFAGMREDWMKRKN